MTLMYEHRFEESYAASGNDEGLAALGRGWIARLERPLQVLCATTRASRT